MHFLPTQVLGRWIDPYVILSLYSRKIVGSEVHESQSSAYAMQLLGRTALAEHPQGLDHEPVIHEDSGSALRATTVLAMAHWLWG
jgi:putative transposase